MEQALSYSRSTLSEDKNVITTLCSAFGDNQRMHLLIGKVSTFPERLQTVITYCFYLAKKVGGIISSSCRNTHLIYYQKSQLYYSVADCLRYLIVALFAVRLTRIMKVFRREQRIKTIRNLEINKNQDKDYLYVWFLAQKKEYKKLDGLVEVKNHLVKEAKILQLPIYMETTEERLLRMYQRIGFEFYTSQQISKDGMTLWFGRYDPNVEL